MSARRAAVSRYQPRLSRGAASSPRHPGAPVPPSTAASPAVMTSPMRSPDEARAHGAGRDLDPLLATLTLFDGPRCVVCATPLPEGSRSHRQTCSVRCRMAHHRRTNGSAMTKVSARSRVREAIKAGRLARLPCVRCDDPDTEAHHSRGYEGDAALDVEFLCRRHHSTAHLGSHPGRSAGRSENVTEAAPAVVRHSTPETAAMVQEHAPLTSVAPPRLPLPIEVRHVPGEWLSNGYPSGIGGRTTYHVAGRSFDTPRAALDFAGR